MSQDFTEHAKLSPSGSKGWFACAGKLVMEAPFPNKSSVDSDNGTAMHSVAATCLTTGVDPSAFVGRLVLVNYKTEVERAVRFTDDMAELTEGYVASLLKIAGGRPIMVESRVDFSRFADVPGQFGTLDAAILFAEVGELFTGDLKTGYVPVSAEDNSQLMIYDLGCIEKMRVEDLALEIDDPFEYAEAIGIKTIRNAIYQPRVTGGWTERVITLAELKAFAETLRSKAQQTVGAEIMVDQMTPEAWRRVYLNPKPNDKDCAYCRAMATCPSYAAAVEAAVGADFEALATGDFKSVVAPDLPAVNLSHAMQAAPMIEAWSKAVRAEVERRLLAGTEVPGFGLELGRKGARKFKDESVIEELVRKQWRLPIEDAYELKLRTPTAFEKMTKPTKALVDGKEVVTPPVIGPRRWKAMAAEITQADPSPSVKPASEIKTPYTVPALSGDDFSTVGEADLT